MTPDDRILAAELVVGLLTAEEAARAEQRRTDEPAFAAEVEWWEARLAPLLVHLFTLATAVLRDSTASGSVWGSAKSTGKVDNLRWAGMRTIAFALIQPMCAIVGEPSLT